MTPHQNTPGTTQNNRAAPYSLALGSLFSESWARVHGMKAATWGAFGYLFLIIMVLAAGKVAADLLFGPAHKDGVAGLFQILNFFITTPLVLSMTYLGARRSVDLPVRAKQLFLGYKCYWRMLGLVVLQAVLVYGLALLLIASFFLYGQSLLTSLFLFLSQLVLGIAIFYLTFSFLFSYTLVLDKNFGVWQAFKASFHAFSQHWFKISVGLILMTILYALSFVLLFVGAIWVLPMMINFHGILYRTAFGVTVPSRFE